MTYNRFSLQHLSGSIQIRADLWAEVKNARKNHYPIPKGIRKDIWKEPHFHEEYIWLLRFLSPEEKITLIDIGGNSGYWAERFLTYYPHSTIYAFEPVKEMFDQYQARFRDHAGVNVYHTAIGNTKEQKSIHVARGYGLTSFHQYEGKLANLNIHFDKNEIVNINTLDSYKTMMHFEHTVIKVDVQGFESQVIEGGKEVFANADVAIVECSFIDEYVNHLPSFGNIVATLREIGLHPVRFGVFDRTKAPIAFERNVLFVKRKYFNKIWLS